MKNTSTSLKIQNTNKVGFNKLFLLQFKFALSDTENNYITIIGFANLAQ